MQDDSFIELVCFTREIYTNKVSNQKKWILLYKNLDKNIIYWNATIQGYYSGVGGVSEQTLLPRTPNWNRPVKIIWENLKGAVSVPTEI